MYKSQTIKEKMDRMNYIEFLNDWTPEDTASKSKELLQ